MEPRLDFNRCSPEAMRVLAGLDRQATRSGLEPRLAELVRLRASQINGCAFCIDRHYAAARAAGDEERRLAAVAVWRDTPFFSDRERAALAWTEALTLIARDHVPDTVWQQIRPHFTPAEITDLTLLIGTINIWNRLAVAFRKTPV